MTELRPELAWLIAACALIVAAQRVLPILALSRADLPQWLRDWLAYVPLGLVAALLTLELAVPRAGGTVAQGLIAILPAFIVVVLTRGLMAGTLAGVVAYFIVLRLW